MKNSLDVRLIYSPKIFTPAGEGEPTSATSRTSRAEVRSRHPMIEEFGSPLQAVAASQVMGFGGGTNFAKCKFQAE